MSQTMISVFFLKPATPCIQSPENITVVKTVTLARNRLDCKLALLVLLVIESLINLAYTY